jgi:hypothetical protein
LFEDSSKIEEYNYFFLDSANNETAFGEYEPTGIIELKNGSMIISTKLHLHFPGQYSIPFENTPEYFEKSKIYREKSHISSGTLIKLKKNFDKEWEIIFKEKRIVKIKLRTDSLIIVAGERTDMKKFWIACINTNGKVQWEKEYSIKSNIRVRDLTLDSLNNIYALIESEQIVPVKLVRLEFGRKKLSFFKPSENSDLYIIGISTYGKKLWATTLHKNNRIWTSGSKLIIGNKNIYVSSSYQGFKKRKKEFIKIEGNNIFELDIYGKIKSKKEVKDLDIFNYNKGLITYSKDQDGKITFYKNFYEIKSIELPQEIKNMWITKTERINGNIIIFGTLSNNLGYLLLKLDRNYNFKDYWNNNKERTCQPVDFLVKDSSIIVVGEKWKDINNKVVRFVNVMKINTN